MIAGVAFFVLSRFPKTLEQDKQLLAGQSLPDDLSLAVQFRLAKKQIMAQLLHDLASRIKVRLATHESPSKCRPHTFTSAVVACLHEHGGAAFCARDAAHLHTCGIITWAS